MPMIGTLATVRHLCLREQVDVVITHTTGRWRQTSAESVPDGVHATHVVTGHDAGAAAAAALGQVMRDKKFLATLDDPERFVIERQTSEVWKVGVARSWRGMRGRTFDEADPELGAFETPRA